MGKSFTLGSIIQSLQKYAPLTFIFDVGGSYEALTRVFGGAYLNVGLKTPGFSINPFSLAPTHENLNFLYLFIRVLIEGNGKYTLTGDDEKSLFAAIERAYKLPHEIRTLSNFVSILGPLGERLQRWIGKGQFRLSLRQRRGHADLRPISGHSTSMAGQTIPTSWSRWLFYVLQRASSEIEKAENAAIFKVFWPTKPRSSLRTRSSATGWCGQSGHGARKTPP